jgi:Right handed beta helix region
LNAREGDAGGTMWIQISNVVSALCLVVASASSIADVVWVSSEGSDTNRGTKQNPLATIGAALLLEPNGTVRLLPGNYVLEQPVQLTNRHSNLTIEAANPALPPLISGGRQVASFVPHRNGLWRAKVDFHFEQLWVNGRRANRARTPNEGWLFMRGPVAYAIDPVTQRPADFARRAFRAADVDIKRLAGLPVEDLQEVRVTAWHSWSVSEHAVARLDNAENTIFLSGSVQWPFFHFGPNQRYRLENYFEALDEPGEWFLARDGWLYYKPRDGEDMTTANVVAPVLAQWLTIRDAENVTVRGIRFEYAASRLPKAGIPGAQGAIEAEAAIHVERSRNVRLERLQLARTGQYAVWFRSGSRESVLSESVLEDLGAGGVRIGEVVPPSAMPPAEAITIERNLIRDGGHVFPGAVGVLVGHSGRNRILNNEIAAFFYSGVSLGWVWGYGPSVAVGNLVEGNHIHHLGFGWLSDMAGIYTLGVSPGTIIRANRIHDVQSYDLYGRGAWGIYADEGTSDVLIENNLVYRTSSGGFHQHYGRDNIVRNNIFAFGKDAQLQRSRIEPHLSFRFERNIVVSDGAPMLHGQWSDKNLQMDSNLFFDVSGISPSWQGRTFRQWQALGRDGVSVIADPQFVDWRRDDFRLKSGSPARRLGFIPISPVTPGLTKAARAESASVRYFPMLPVKAEPPPQKLELREDFESQPEGSGPAFASVVQEGKGDSVGTTDEQAASGRYSLKMQDAVGLSRPFNPHFFYRPNHVRGVTTVRFSIQTGRGADFFHEWRDDQAPYLTGPSLAIRQGRLIAGGRDIAAVPEKRWVSLEVSAGLGGQARCTWALRMTLGNDKTQEFQLPCRDTQWSKLSWLGFVSNASDATAIYLDDIVVSNEDR